MRRISFLFISVSLFLFAAAQPVVKQKKYPSLLWEISGNGLKKPSYLIGTMHVSSKLAFHLADSFYYAIHNAQVVALETNPESWQEDMSKYDLSGKQLGGNVSGGYWSMPNEYLSINTLKFFAYDKKIERSLYSNPSTINNLLYRSYGNESNDFEEDTYLDMYIFQCGKKWGKRVTGVENYGESMRLMEEAYKDAAKDKNKKERNIFDRDEDYSTQKLQEAYRNGDLDLLDSINRFNSFSDAFDEKFLYRRNEIQAHSIDSIIHSGSSLFVGVGAAHLPGTRGVIELLRKKGYRLRPVKMGERDSQDKEQVEKLKVPVVFKTTTAEDGLFKVDIPGKFYKFGDDAALDQQQYADMANGSYYMVTRIMTNAWMRGQSPEDVYKKIDSLLYENIPGKIISRIPIIKNGYKGFDITNRTRRGDLQRYNIFITPFEIIFFKMSGNNDYVNGDEAKTFFGSIHLREYANSADPATASWKKYSPAYGGFAIDLPHDPYIGNDGSWIYDAEDKTDDTHYRVVRSDIHNYHFVEEDSFDLDLMDESFMASDFIDTELNRSFIKYKGYPAMDSKYRDKSGSIYLVRFIIQGPHYYTLVAKGKLEKPSMLRFLNSFEIRPFIYRDAITEKDTSLYYTVQTSVFTKDAKIKLNLNRSYLSNDDDEEEGAGDNSAAGIFRGKVIANDTTGEKIYVSFYRTPLYYQVKDSTHKEKYTFGDDTSWITRSIKKTTFPDKSKMVEVMLSDTGSSRVLWVKDFYKDGKGFSLISELDTLTAPSAFLKKFYETFTPSDTLRGTRPFAKKSGLFFADFLSPDSSLHKRAVNHIEDIELDSSDIPQLKKCIASMSWDEKKYLEIKKALIGKFGEIKSPQAADYLKQIYFALDDTVQLQYAVLENLLAEKTAYAYSVFRDIINAEPPVLEASDESYSYMNSLYRSYSHSPLMPSYHFNDGSFLDELFDSLSLTKTILPDLLPLLNLEDYKKTLMSLLGNMADSNQVQPKDYDMYFSKFLIEAKQALKKQAIAEKKKAIAKAEMSKEDKKDQSSDNDGDKDTGNEDLALYARLLMPYWGTNASVQPLIMQMLQSNDKQLKYRIMLLLLQKGKPFNDSLLTYFGSLDDYRYNLYSTLGDMKLTARFPARYNNPADLARSLLLATKTSKKPDTLVYLDKMKTVFYKQPGYIYFYKYKNKKDDLSWKLATVGLIADDARHFQIVSASHNDDDDSIDDSGLPNERQYNFTRFSETQLKDDQPITVQLKKNLKKMLYSHRKSARKFYEDDNERRSTIDLND